MPEKRTPAPVATGAGAGDRQAASDGRKHSPSGAEVPARPVYVLRLEPLPGIDGPRALRELLKRARRNHGLRCLACHEKPPADAGTLPAPEGLLDRRAAWLAEAERRRAGR